MALSRSNLDLPVPTIILNRLRGKMSATNEGHLRTYINILIALMVLTVVTVLASSKFGVVNFGTWSLAVALLIASVKATLVALYFMHLKYENPLTWLYAAFPLILLVILLVGVFLDNPLRTHTNPIQIENPL